MADNSARKQEIVDASIYLFASEGYNKCTVRNIAEKVGITNPALFYYFKTKEAILQSLLEEYKGLFAAGRVPVEELVSIAGHEPLADVFVRIFHPLAPPGAAYERSVNLFIAIESLKHEHEGAKRIYNEYTNEGSRRYIEEVLIALIEAGICKPVDTYWASYYFHSFALKLYGDALYSNLDYEQSMLKYRDGIRTFCAFFEQILKM